MMYLTVALGVLFLVALFFGRTFFALCSLSLVGGWLAFVSAKTDNLELLFNEYAVRLFVLIEIGVGEYALLSVIEYCKRKRIERRKAREEICRRAVYMLPDRENEFLRERLQTGLRVEEREEPSVSKQVRREIRLDYVRGLLSSLQASPLSAADRLETESLCKLVNLYAASENISVSELRSLNECMLKLLKLSAKYAVDCA